MDEREGKKKKKEGQTAECLLERWTAARLL